MRARARGACAAGVNKIYLGFERFNIRINYLACTNRRILTPDQSLEARPSSAAGGRRTAAAPLSACRRTAACCVAAAAVQLRTTAHASRPRVLASRAER